MTDKELEIKAKEYANKTQFTEYDNPSLAESLDISEEIKQAYLAGAKENQPTVEEILKRLLKGGYVKSGIYEKGDKFYTQPIIVAVAESELQRFRELETKNNLLKFQIESLEKEKRKLEQEKCELLGIIQQKDKLIKKLICCGNCTHHSIKIGEDYFEYECKKRDVCLDDFEPCQDWELA